MSTDKWGDWHKNQLEASYEGVYDRWVDIPEKRIFGFIVRPAGKKKVKESGIVSTAKEETIPDEVVALRKFQHRCGLIKAINVISDRGSMVNVCLDGFSGIYCGVGMVLLALKPELEDGPVAEITFQGHCTRYGAMRDREDLFVELIFKDKEEMGECFVVKITTTDAQNLKA